jgi:hypothetical protein
MGDVEMATAWIGDHLVAGDEFGFRCCDRGFELGVVKLFRLATLRHHSRLSDPNGIRLCADSEHFYF